MPDRQGVEGSPQVLIADDDEILLALVGSFLKKNGFDVVYARNGREAIDKFQQTIPDLVLMDADMPEMDGFKACAILKQSPEGARVPILMVTALSDDHSVDRAFSAGAEDFVGKPIHWAVLRQRAKLLIERKRAHEKIQLQAHYDALTGLPNRNLFLDRLQQEIVRAKRKGSQLALLFIDLDRFKWVNDTMGHAAGDELLQQVAHRLVDSVRESDTVARLGGDEFTIILPDIHAHKDLLSIAQKSLPELARPFFLSTGEANISGSMGIALYPRHAQTLDELIRMADDAMYGAKKRGKNNYCLFDDA